MSLSGDDIAKIVVAAIKEAGLQEKPKVLDDPDPTKLFAVAAVLDEPSDDEILYYSTPYYDYLMEQKELKKQRISEEAKERDNG